jgi:hypothetical protein
VDHLEEFHIPVDDAVDVLHRYPGVLQCRASRLMDHLGLVDVLAMARILGLTDPYYTDVPVFLSVGYWFTSLSP